MDLFCWGNITHDLLDRNEKKVSLAKIPWNPNTPVRQIAIGEHQILFLTADRKVYKCERNNQPHYNLRKRQRDSPFALIAGLHDPVIVAIACGSHHSMVLTKDGKVMSWGDNNCGQLGQATDKSFFKFPQVVFYLINRFVVQIACGNNHSLALTRCGELYSWGSNIYGQMGVKSPEEFSECNFPTRVITLLGIPVSTIACGGDHSFVISKSGAVFGWGRNNFGQCGLENNLNREYPTQLETLGTLDVRYVACGDEFSIFLTGNGSVFTCGAGTHGQLGHGSNMNESLPRIIKKLKGITITQVACGKCHSLALDSLNGRVYRFGLDSSGNNSISLPKIVIGPWVSPRRPCRWKSHNAAVIHQIFSGGDQSIVTTTLLKDNVSSADLRQYISTTQILTINPEYTKQLHRDFFDSLAIVFRSQACLNGSFLLKNRKHVGCSSENNGLDLNSAQMAFDHFRSLKCSTPKKAIWDKVIYKLIPSLDASLANLESMRLYLLLPLYHEFDDCKNYIDLHVPFAKAIFKLPENYLNVLKKWWSETTLDYYSRLVKSFLHVAIHVMSFKKKRQRKYSLHSLELEVILKLLQCLFDVNNERKDRLHYKFFYWRELSDFVDIHKEIRCLENSENEWNICNFPFLFDASAKAAMLQADLDKHMDTAIANGISDCIFYNQFYFVVRRDSIVQDSLRELQRQCNSNPDNLKRRLLVIFNGEEAIDAGGVRKEFFMLLIRNLFDPKYGMFKVFEESRLSWFADLTFETDTSYYLIGIICGLAIYNLTIINLPFPLALYKKLLGKSVDLEDLRELSPTEANSLQTLLDYNGDNFQENFNLTFEISRDALGGPNSVNLKPNGSEIPITRENRQEFINLYVDFILNKSVETQYNAFYKGFMTICSGRIINTFQPEELMIATLGNADYDWQTFQDNCVYCRNCTMTDQPIKWFWETFHELSEAEKKSFLRFLTGTDRLPIEGMKAIKIGIQLIHDERFLPVAHTCFNLLDLPRYKTKESLKYKLEQAIYQTQGFGLI